MNLLSGSALEKVFSGDTLFDNVSFTVYDTDKIGFIGVNGAGKSTLFRMMTGELDPDGGELSRSREARIGYLEQYAVSDGDRSIMDEMLTVFAEVVAIEAELEGIYGAMGEPDADLDALVGRQEVLQERFDQLDGAYYQSRIKSALMGLGFSEEDFSMPLSQLSGGQKTRIALAKILLSDANLLLLDEPTNHLDVSSIEWLEDFLISYKGAFIVISHDRYFLDMVTEKTFEMENGHFRSYDGNYTAYMAQKEIERLTELRNYEGAVSEIHRLEEVIEQQRRWKHKKNKKTHTLDNTRKAIQRLEKNLVAPEKAPDSIRFQFHACDGGAQRVLETADLSMAFGENRLFDHVDMLIKKGEKVFLLGPNGCGKTSLLKIIMGIYEQTGGTYKVGDNIRVGYYDQLKENLHWDKTVIDEVWDEYRHMTQREIRNALATFLFRGEDVFKEVKALSGGELARVELTKLMLRQVNFLIMDEPTNHLDIASREALEDALAGYEGTMLVVSHDRYFINKLADRILYLTPEGVVKYDGNYDDFYAARQEQTEKAVPQERPAEKIEEKGIDFKERKRQEAEKRKVLSRFEKVEGKIGVLEAQIGAITQESQAPEIASDYAKLGELAQQIDALHRELDEYMVEWETLQQTIDKMGQGM